MADEASAISVLQAQNAHLSGELAKVTSDRDRHATARATAETERDTHKAAAKDAAKHADRVTQLEGELRSIRHGTAFAKAAKAAGVREDAIDDVFALSGYKAEKDEIDPRAFEALLETAKESRGYAFTVPASEVTDGTEAEPESSSVITPGERLPAGKGRGTAASPVDKGVKVTASQLADPKWSLDPKNQAVKLAAAKAGRFAGYAGKLVGGA